jgi:hypothetical protein
MKQKQSKPQAISSLNHQGNIISIVTIVIVLSAVSFAFIFFSRRGEDVGRITSLLSSFLSSFTSGKIMSARATIETVAGVVVSLLIVLAWYGLGDLIVKAVSRFFGGETLTSNKYFDWAGKCAFGSGVWSTLWFFIGISHLYRKPVALIALLIGFVFLSLKLIKDRAKQKEEPTNERKKSASANKSLFARLALVVVITPVSLAFISALAPPTGKDELIYHLSLPKAYLNEGALVEVPNNIASFYAHGTEMHGVWALLLGSFINERVAEVAFGVTLFSFFPLALLVVYGWSRELKLIEEWSLIATAFVATIPTAFYVASNGYIDLALALYLLVAARMVALWWTSQNDVHLFLMAIVLGAALAAKLTATFAFFPLLVVFLLRAREAQQSDKEEDDAKPKTNANRILLAGALALVFAAALASPWYLNNWAKTGSPIFPFYPNVWKGQAQGWDTERSRLLQLFLADYGGSQKSALDYVAAPLYISLVAQPEKPDLYDGVIGISFLVGTILLLFVFWKVQTTVEVKIIAGITTTLFFAWLFSSQQLRFLLPTLSLLSLAIATGASEMESAMSKASKSSILHWTMLATMCCGLLVVSAWFLDRNPLRASVGGENRDEYLRRHLDYYPYYEIINSQLPLDAKIWLVNVRRDSYHLKRPYFSDYTFEDYTLVKYVKEAKDLNELRARIRSDGITHLMVRHDVLLDYDKSSVVDERLSTQENKVKMDLLDALLKDGTKVLRSDKKFMLVELPK